MLTTVQGYGVVKGEHLCGLNAFPCLENGKFIVQREGLYCIHIPYTYLTFVLLARSRELGKLASTSFPILQINARLY